MKLYLVPAVIMLMIITSMGIFGFLSKAHLDQNIVSGDVQAKIALYDEKIRISRENIDANRRALKQLDEAVDQVMGRSTTEQGAERSVQIRRQQGPERQRLIREIETEQKKISSLNEERAPIAAEVRKVEAEVGPIKYIAALIYDEVQDATVLERAVRWVIIMLVVVFDPLAIMMLLAATESFAWSKENLAVAKNIEHLDAAEKPGTPDIDSKSDLDINDHSKSTQDTSFTDQQILKSTPPVEQVYLKRPWVDRVPGIDRIPPQVYVRPEEDEDYDIFESDTVKKAIKLWKTDNPTKTLKEQRRLFEKGAIDMLPWEAYMLDPRLSRACFHGEVLPSGKRGDLFLLTDVLPTKLYKHNGDKWIMIDKHTTDQYLYDDYVNFLIDKLSSKEYYAEWLTDAEQQAIEETLNKTAANGHT